MTYNYPDVHLHSYIDAGSRDVLEAVLQRVHLWMTLGLLITAGVAAFVSSLSLTRSLANQPLIFFGLAIAELVLVVRISWRIDRLSTSAAIALFLLYAGLNGLSFSVLFAMYALHGLASAFFVTAVMFGVMSAIGSLTKISLAKMGTFLLMGLVGLVIALLVNIFWANAILGWVVAFVGMILFLGLTAFDTQRIRRMTATALFQGNEEIEARLGILGALTLYLDFINLFLFLLRLGGRRR